MNDRKRELKKERKRENGKCVYIPILPRIYYADDVINEPLTPPAALRFGVSLPIPPPSPASRGRSIKLMTRTIDLRAIFESRTRYYAFVSGAHAVLIMNNLFRRGTFYRDSSFLVDKGEWK